MVLNSLISLYMWRCLVVKCSGHRVIDTYILYMYMYMISDACVQNPSRANVSIYWSMKKQHDSALTVWYVTVCCTRIKIYFFLTWGLTVLHVHILPRWVVLWRGLVTASVMASARCSRSLSSAISPLATGTLDSDQLPGSVRLSGHCS